MTLLVSYFVRFCIFCKEITYILECYILVVSECVCGNVIAVENEATEDHLHPKLRHR